jgi:hypothetical protein
LEIQPLETIETEPENQSIAARHEFCDQVARVGFKSMSKLKRLAGIIVRRSLAYIPFWLRFRRVQYGYELRYWYRRIMFGRIF